MLLASSSLASAPLMADSERAFVGSLAESELLLTANSVAAAAALYTGAAALRQRRVHTRPMKAVFSERTVYITSNRIISL